MPSEDIHYLMSNTSSGIWPNLIDFTVCCAGKKAIVSVKFGFLFYLLSSTAQVLKVCRTPGPTACLKLLQKYV